MATPIPVPELRARFIRALDMARENLISVEYDGPGTIGFTVRGFLDGKRLVDFAASLGATWVVGLTHEGMEVSMDLPDEVL